MSDATTKNDDHDDAEDFQRLLTIGGAAALVLVLLALTFSLVLIFALRSDVALLEEQARTSAKATKALQEELAGLKENLAAAANAARRRAGDARPDHIDAADPASDCVVRPGAKDSLADCMKLGPKG
ncbi:MAG: hypothetical protein PHY45_13570 [Rhodocyclaceae bacterium]|nr:hypothetical protein [Rhodocyclaceae bacterium]